MQIPFLFAFSLVLHEKIKKGNKDRKKEDKKEGEKNSHSDSTHTQWIGRLAHTRSSNLTT